MGAGGVHVTGWGYDPASTGTALGVEFRIDGAIASSTTASTSRPDVDRATGAGPNHGFDTLLKVGAGAHQLCAYGVNAPNGWGDVPFGCASVTLNAPVGSVDAMTSTLLGVKLAGWAFDPDATGTSLNVTVTVDGQAQSIVANGYRPDVNASNGSGSYHGFSTVLPVSAGSHTICVTVPDIPTGTFATTLTCGAISWPPAVTRGAFVLPQGSGAVHRGAR